MARGLPDGILDLSVIFKTLKIIWKSSRKYTMVRIAIVIVLAILPLIPLYLFKLLLDSFVDFQTEDLSIIYKILIGLGLTKLIGIFLNNMLSYNNSVQGDIVSDFMSNILIQKSLNIDLEYYDSDKYHDQFHRAIGQGGSKPLNILGSVTALGQSAITLLALLALLFSLHWAITLILFVITIPVAIVRFIFSEKLVELQKVQTQTNRVANYYRTILTGGNTAQEVRIFGFGRALLSKFLFIAKGLRNERRDLYAQQLKWVSLAQSAEAIAMIAALGFIIYNAVQGKLSVGDISMYYLAFQKGQGSLSGIMSSAIALHSQKLMLNYLYEFLEMNKKVLNTASPTPFPLKVKSIKVEGLCFVYPETEKLILDNINFEAKKGEIIAIVGENGSGKTTLIKVLNRLYDPTKGSVLFNEINYKKFDIADIRDNISIVFQKFATYAFTVKENLTLSRKFRGDNTKEIEKSLELSEAKNFIEDLPQKYNSNLGRIFKNGHELSKGQWQKIALSRAFYKNAEIIILDEPTSFIDPLAEDKIFKNLKSIAKDKILILITHRIYNLKMADKILVLDKGKLIEYGDHNTLIANAGLYKEMFEKQGGE